MTNIETGLALCGVTWACVTTDISVGVSCSYSGSRRIPGRKDPMDLGIRPHSISNIFPNFLCIVQIK